MNLGRADKAHLRTLISRASPLTGDFFRSVAFRHIHPDDVISGTGTRLQGGRFVPRGVAAVYASLEEETALREVTCRKRVISGRSHVDLRDYPRMIYVIRIATERNLDLSLPVPRELKNLLIRSLRPGPHTVSQAIGALCIEAGIESVIFPSATGSGHNVVVYLPNASAGSVIVLNRAAVLAALLPSRH